MLRERLRLREVGGERCEFATRRALFLTVSGRHTHIPFCLRWHDCLKHRGSSDLPSQDPESQHRCKIPSSSSAQTRPRMHDWQSVASRGLPRRHVSICQCHVTWWCWPARFRSRFRHPSLDDMARRSRYFKCIIAGIFCAESSQEKNSHENLPRINIIV